MCTENTVFNGQFILIDDDSVNNIISQLTIEMTLGKVSVQSFTEPLQGFEYIRTSFTVENKLRGMILLDLNMPIMTGWEFLERFDDLPVEIKENIKIYILSSSIDERDRKRSYANKNVNDFLTKPLSKETVTKIIGSRNPPT